MNLLITRVKHIRNSLDLNQTDFAKRLGLTQTAYSMIETEVRPLSDRHIKIISSEFNVNESWLRTGSGEMYSTSPYEKEFMKIFDNLTLDSQDYLVTMARELVTTQEKLLKKGLEQLQPNIVKDNDATRIAELNGLTPEQQKEINAKLEIYKHELEIEAKQTEKSSTDSEITNIKQTEISEDNNDEDIQTFKIASRNGPSELRLSKEQRRELIT